jgi:predicted heme/steroid binding protein
MKEFSEKELARYNGKNGEPAYIAYRGSVYDLTGSFLWKDGNHEGFHNAGVDLTDAMEQAPHGGELIEKFPKVGTMRVRREKISRHSAKTSKII